LEHFPELYALTLSVTSQAQTVLAIIETRRFVYNFLTTTYNISQFEVWN
jgi:hypothetical protein